MCLNIEIQGYEQYVEIQWQSLQAVHLRMNQVAGVVSFCRGACRCSDPMQRGAIGTLHCLRDLDWFTILRELNPNSFRRRMPLPPPLALRIQTSSIVQSRPFDPFSLPFLVCIFSHGPKRLPKYFYVQTGQVSSMPLNFTKLSLPLPMGMDPLQGVHR